MILCVGHNQMCNLKKRPDSLLVNPVCAECSLTVAPPAVSVTPISYPHLTARWFPKHLWVAVVL